MRHGRGRWRRSARERWVIAVRWTAAIVFVGFGAAKFANHTFELVSFRQYGLPLPDAFVYAIGVLELGGGLLLASGVLVRLAALVLAGDMVGAIIVSGVAKGELISLVLAPAELVAMLVLLWAGSGAHSLRPTPPVAASSAQVSDLLR
jgi:uncharacterized membrane protein YphA (DoxX/SURF4 family)